MLFAFIVLFDECVSQIAKDKCKFLGNIISGSTPMDFTMYWNQVTPENAGKWGSVETIRDIMNWTQLDNAYNTAKSNNFPFRQHTFVWGQQQPEWMSTLSATEQKQEIEEWIQAYCERYPQTDFIDVVNEPLHAPPSYRLALGGSGLSGWEWVVWTFEKARQYCPNAKLFLNDYNIVNDNGATTSYLQIINLLKSKNLIDGIGEQGHFLESTPMTTIKANLDRLAATGLPIHISELDVHLADDTQQKNKYEELFPVLWSHPAVYGITLWGYRQGEIWRENAYLARTNGSERPALSWLKSYVANSTGGTLCSPVSVREELDAPFHAYPNPSEGKIFISLPEGKYSVVIVDVTGKIVDAVNVDGSTPIEFSLSAGFYLIKVIGPASTTVSRIVVN
ncbi:MAG TPA: endo-1,4-beta-xylanase [Chryseosolibacter sp.]